MSTRDRDPSHKGNAGLKSAVGAEMLVRDVMTTKVITVQKYEDIGRVATILSSKNISGLPVVDKDNKVIGIVTQADVLSMFGIRRENALKDLVRHLIGEQLPERRLGDIVGDIMTSPAETISPLSTVAQATQIMDEKRIRRLPVVAKDKELLGIVTRADILKAVIKKLKWDAPDNRNNP